MSELTEAFKNQMIELLEKKDFRKLLVKELNDAIDIPIIDENTEKDILNNIYKVILKTIKKL
jgi:hypothetical protein